MSKKVQIGSKPTASKPAPGNADAWVENRAAPTETPAAPSSEKMKRLTIDVPESLHRDIKRQCAEQGAKIADVARALLHDWVQKHRKP